MIRKFIFLAFSISFLFSCGGNKEKTIFTITWQDYDGTVLSSTTVNKDEIPVYDKSNPSREKDEQYIYTFNGWSPEIVPAVMDTTYTATYSTELRKYKITWVNDDGSILKTDEDVEYGTTPKYLGDTPIKFPSESSDFTFKGWSPEIKPVTGDQTYTATFDELIHKYTVVWKNYNGTVLETDYDVPYGTKPKYDGPTPTRPSTAEAIYAFKGWSPTVEPIKGDTVYVAQFSNTLQKYTITWKNYDGTTLETDTNVPYGTTPSYDGPTPTKTQDEQFTYKFNNKWSPDVGMVVENKTYVAQFDNILRKYTVTWKNYDGTVLETDYDVPYGSEPKYDGPTPTKPPTQKETFGFRGWSPMIQTVKSDQTYVAEFSNTLQKCTITWKNYDGTILQTDSNKDYGSSVSYTGGTPSKNKDARATYTFSGWSPTVTQVLGDQTYIALFSETINTYKITWMGGIDGKTLIKEDVLSYGDTPKLPAYTQTLYDEMYEYKFNCWSPEVVPVTGDTTYYAQYDQTLRYFNVTWKNYDGTTLEEDTVLYGHVPTYDGSTPTKIIGSHNFKFIGWDKEIIPTTSDTTYTAKYYEKISFTYNGTNCFVNGKEEFVDLYDYADSTITYKIEPMNTYSLPSSIDVFVDDLKMSTSSYSYNSSTGDFSIKANLGDIKLVAEGVKS